MKNQISISAVLFIMSFSTQLFAQEPSTITKQKTKSNNTNERISFTNQLVCVVKISSIETGCSIVFDNAIVSPRDLASGLATGRRMHKPPIRFDISPINNTIAEVLSPRDVASGQASGKRSPETTANISKATYTWIKNAWDKSKKQTVKPIAIENGEFSLPADSDDGEYELEISFTYQKIEIGNADEKSLKTYVAGRFILEIEGGVCRSIKEKGVSVKK
jgi:hypothetical protein